MALIYDEMGNVVGDDGSVDPAASDTAVVAPSEIGYLQRKVNEFQAVLYSVDETATALEQMLVMDISEDDVNEIQAQLSEYYTRRSAFKFAAESFNALASMINSVGGSMPSVNIPAGLGLAPLAIPLATAAAIAGAAILVSFGVGWVTSSRDLASRIAMNISDPQKRDAALVKASEIAAASDATMGGGLGQVANIIKWLAIGGAAYIVYQMVNQQSGKRK